MPLIYNLVKNSLKVYSFSAEMEFFNYERY